VCACVRLFKYLLSVMRGRLPVPVACLLPVSMQIVTCVCLCVCVYVCVCVCVFVCVHVCICCLLREDTWLCL